MPAEGGRARGSDCELQEDVAATGIEPALVGFPFATHGLQRVCSRKHWCGAASVQAEKKLLEDLNAGKINKEYLPVTGLAAFLDVTSQV